MAQRAIIGINGDPLGFDELLDRIQTSGIGGGSVTWVPEADTRCETLNVTANGTYVAADAGKYGYDYVTVSVPGSSVTGRDPDTGEEVEVHTDPETGEIVETVIPVEIRVTTPPTKTVYTHGETIDYSGIVVHAYSATGQDMGAVPFNELVFPETTADAQKTDGWTDGQGLNATEVAYTQHWDVDWQDREFAVYVSRELGQLSDNAPVMLKGIGVARLLVTRYNGKNYAALLSGDDHFNYTGYYPENEHYKYSNSGAGAYRTTLNEFTLALWENIITNLPTSTVNPTTVDPANLHATQSLPVQWSRTGDGAVLETSFDIQVNSAA